MPARSTRQSIRLQKVIAQSGLTSRRKAETLILAGRVTVNGKVTTAMGTKVDAARDHIKVDGRHLKPAAPDVFLILNKPAGYLSTMKDPEGRPTIADLLDRRSIRTFPVGRLDYDSEGLLLLTNNGDIAQTCLHPRFHIDKTYLVKIKGHLAASAIRSLEDGLTLDDGPTAPASLKKVRRAAVNSWVELTIHEGRNHQVKRMFDAVGHPVLKLKRIRFGPIQLGTLPTGSSRHLTDRETAALRQRCRGASEPAQPDIRKPRAGWAKGRTPKRRTQGQRPPSTRRTAAPQVRAQE